MPSLIATITDQLEAHQARRDELMAAAEAAGSFNDVREELDGIDAAVPGLKADLARAERDREVIRRAPAAPAPADSPLSEGPVDLGKAVTPPRRLSDRFLSADEWQEFLADNRGRFSPTTRVQSPKVSIEGSILPFLRGREGALLTGASSTSGGAFISPDVTGIYDEGAFRRELTLLDLITRGTTDSDTVEYVRKTSFTNAAASVGEATSIETNDDDGRKPFSSWAFQKVQPGVKTIAHGAAATNNSLADAGQLRTIVESDLRYGLLEEVEDMIINGNGVGEAFEGILEAATGDQVHDTDEVTTLRKALTKVRVQGKTRATAIVMHPYAAEALDIDLINDAASYYRAATIDEVARIWGVPIVQNEGIDEHRAIVGDFRLAVLWDRQQTTIEATSGYLDFFMKNLVAIRAEMRAAFGVIRPSAFVITDVSY